MCERKEIDHSGNRYFPHNEPMQLCEVLTSAGNVSVVIAHVLCWLPKICARKHCFHAVLTQRSGLGLYVARLLKIQAIITDPIKENQFNHILKFIDPKNLRKDLS